MAVSQSNVSSLPLLTCRLTNGEFSKHSCLQSASLTAAVLVLGIFARSTRSRNFAESFWKTLQRRALTETRQ